jgi:hypothetical protein
MNPANINQAMINRVNTQNEYKMVNNRIDAVNNRINGVDVVFRENSEITGAVISDLLSGTELEWLSADVINAATVYEAPAPSSYINNLRPAGMWKGHVVDSDGKFIADTYSPLESFVRNADDSIMFSLIQPLTTVPAEKNYGGNLPGVIMRLISAATDDTDMTAVRSAILSNIASSDVLNTSTIYYIQSKDLISDQLGGAHAESFTLHFE